MRFNWVHATVADLDPAGARELVVDAPGGLVVPQKVHARLGRGPPSGGPG